MHPSFAKQACDFKSHNERITVYHDIRINYIDVFARSKILITDYSSVATDLAYMKKPVIYTQFDRERFLEKHTGKEGYFDFDEMRFGPVCKTCQETVKELESIIRHDSKMESKYEKRRDSFFAYDDKRNSERIYKEIKAIGKQH